ncbi:MAG: DNA cytosine methyltransferase [Prevotellaceae bacterium]|jgi:DNA (cytosine-5)-methyltransferase 1|nr:DNA cytosine methyltransferase [Prevotellaceae bacterium]
MNKLFSLNFIDLFAGAGGLSEGFIRAGYTPLAHIGVDRYACDTLKTRAAFHWLNARNQLQAYKTYLHEKQEKEDGSKLWKQVPQSVIDVVQSKVFSKHEWYSEQIQRLKMSINELKRLVV